MGARSAAEAAGVSRALAHEPSRVGRHCRGRRRRGRSRARDRRGTARLGASGRDPVRVLRSRAAATGWPARGRRSPTVGQRRAEAGGVAAEHGDGRATGARPRVDAQSPHGGLWPGCRSQGRRARRDARPAGQARRCARLRHQSLGRGHRRTRGRHGAGGPAARAGNPVPQVRGPGRRADQRLRNPAMAHAQPLCRADGASHAHRILQVRRPVAQPDQRGAVRACPRMEGGRALERRGRGWLAACRTAWRRPGDVPRAPRDARCGLGTTAVPWG